MVLTVGNTINEASERLAEAGIESPMLDAQLLLAHTLECERLDIIAHPERILTDSQATAFAASLQKRSERYPLAYIIGHKEFFGIDLDISDGILIPRPETELLVEQCIRTFNSQPKTHNPQPLISDIGVGSGAIAIAIAMNIPSAAIYGTEISPKALKVAGRNIAKYNLASRVQLLEGDMLEPLKRLDLKFDAIVSNPPYIPTADIRELQPEVASYEPREALDGGEDGLNAYRMILPDAYHLLNERGFVAVEIGEGEAAGVSDIAYAVGYRLVEIVRDLAGIERVVVASK